MKGEAGTDKKLTIVHFMPSSIVGGAETATLKMTDATKTQFRHIVFCLPEATTLRDLFHQQGIETTAYSPPIPSLRHGLRFYKQSRVVARQLKAAGADIVHFADKFAAYYNSFAAFLSGARVVCHIRLSHPTLTTRDRLCLLPVDSFIFVSQDAKRTFALSVPESKARVIYDWIEIPKPESADTVAAVRRELGIPEGHTVIGMVARVAPQKDYYTLAAAAVEVLSKYPNTRFLIVGENSLVDSHRRHYEEVLQKLTELNIADKFIFTGHRSDVSRLIAAMDISVLCTHREGFGLAIAEAMAMHKPALATGVGGVLEVVSHGVTGYLHQHLNSKELAEQIIYLLDNPEEAKRIADAGYQHVRVDFSRENFIREISNAYSDVMRSKNGAHA